MANNDQMNFHHIYTKVKLKSAPYAKQDDTFMAIMCRKSATWKLPINNEKLIMTIEIDIINVLLSFVNNVHSFRLNST